jgi:hypothetical protein
VAAIRRQPARHGAAVGRLVEGQRGGQARDAPPKRSAMRPRMRSLSSLSADTERNCCIARRRIATGNGGLGVIAVIVVTVASTTGYLLRRFGNEPSK